MNEDLQKLVDDFLDGNADGQAVARLDGLIRKDPSVRLRLLRSAAMEDGMKQLVGTCKTCSLPERRRTLSGWFGGTLIRWVAAAAVVAAIGGWGAALFIWQDGKMAENSLQVSQTEVSRLNEKLIASYAEVSHLYGNMLASQAEASVLKKELIACKSAVTQLETQLASLPAQPGDSGQPRVMVLQSRGLTMLLPTDKSEKPTELHRNSNVVYNRTLWTCPWGGLDMAYQDGTSVSLDRSSEATLSQADDGRQVRVHKGIIYLTRHPTSSDKYKGPILIETPHGKVELTDAQITLAVSADKTTVEMATGQAEIIGPDGQKTTIKAGQYAIVQPNADVRPVNGRLEWRLEPMKNPERKGG
ncbi:MAG: FecR domain-containing protein [Planctomycetes bacterium]|nr:FecR domain-containing protein [Planctomycetota bacterium]